MSNESLGFVYERAHAETEMALFLCQQREENGALKAQVHSAQLRSKTEKLFSQQCVSAVRKDGVNPHHAFDLYGRFQAENQRQEKEMADQCATAGA